MLQNLHLKLLALLSALLFWFFIVSFEQTIKELPQPIAIQAFNLSEELAIKNELASVVVKVSSDTQDISKIKASSFKAFVDLQELKKGKHTVEVQVTTDNKELTIVQIVPKTLSILLEDRASKEVPIEILFEGEPNEGFELGEAKISESKVTVSGIASNLEAVDKAIALVSLRGNESTDVIRSVVLSVLNSENQKMQQISVDPTEVDVFITILQSDQIKTVGIKPVFEGELDSDDLWLSKLSLNPPTVHIKGSYEILSKIDFIETEAIPLSGVKTSIIKRATLIFPDDVQPVDGEAVTTLIEINLAPVKIRTD